MPKKTPLSDKSKSEAVDIVDKISSDDAQVILRILVQEDKDIAKRTKKIATQYLSKVDSDEVADEVYFDLDSLTVEEVWDRSGATRNGYMEPGDVASEMFEEALEPHREELIKYQNLSMLNQAKEYCQGILKGIHRFQKESKSEYKNWAEDIPEEYFAQLVREWQEQCQNPGDAREMEEFVRTNFPE